jgi:hypothetical protein
MRAHFRKLDSPRLYPLALVLFKKDGYHGQFSCTLALVRARTVPTHWILV